MCQRRRGLAQALFASLLASACSVLVKASEVSIGQASFLSSVVILFCSLPVAIYRAKDLFPRGYRLRLVLFSVLNGLTVLADYQAMRLMPLGDEAVVAYTSIIFTLLLAKTFLGEACSRDKVLCSICIVAGVALISQPASGSTSYPNYRLGLVLTLFGALCDAASYIFLKELSEIHCSVILMSCGLASMIVTGPMCLIEGWSVPKEPIFLITIIFLTFFHDICLILALNLEEAGLVSLVQASDIVFSYILELFFFEEPYSCLRLFGAGLVSSSVCIVALIDIKSPVRMLVANELPLFFKASDSKIRNEIGLKAEEMFKWLHLRDR